MIYFVDPNWTRDVVDPTIARPQLKGADRKSRKASRHVLVIVVSFRPIRSCLARTRVFPILQAFSSLPVVLFGGCCCPDDFLFWAGDGPRESKMIAIASDV